MSIRYFATNRDCENLGREFSRGERLGLQKGGYHFVDMEAYMSYYLSEVEAKTMPQSVIVNKSQEKAETYNRLAKGIELNKILLPRTQKRNFNISKKLLIKTIDVKETKIEQKHNALKLLTVIRDSFEKGIIKEDGAMSLSQIEYLLYRLRQSKDGLDIGIEDVKDLDDNTIKTLLSKIVNEGTYMTLLI